MRRPGGRLLALVASAAAACGACRGSSATGVGGARTSGADTTVALLTADDIAALPVASADVRVAYGPDSLHQFGDLRLPRGSGPFPVAVVLHGGCWLSQYGLDQISQPAAYLALAGIATWTIEYSRVGDPRGGWPGTFTDVARGIDAVRRLAARYPLDTTRVVLVGHSAGGQLALWAASRSALPADAPPDTPAGPTLRIRAVVALAGISDLAEYTTTSGCGSPVVDLLHGTPSQVLGRYHAVSPINRLPIGVPVRLVHGDRDQVVPRTQSTTFGQRATAAGDSVVVQIVPRSGHFELIAPGTVPWISVLQAVQDVVPPAGR